MQTFKFSVLLLSPFWCVSLTARKSRDTIFRSHYYAKKPQPWRLIAAYMWESSDCYFYTWTLHNFCIFPRWNTMVCILVFVWEMVLFYNFYSMVAAQSSSILMVCIVSIGYRGHLTLFYIEQWYDRLIKPILTKY